MISERDILGTQLVRRNDELALLYEKIKIQQSTLNKGRFAFLYCCFSIFQKSNNLPAFYSLLPGYMCMVVQFALGFSRNHNGAIYSG